jgi:hypothetical protein
MAVAFIALLVGITGGAFAAATIDTGDIKNGAVTKKKLHKNSVNSKKVKNKTLKAKDFADGQLEQGIQGIPGLKGEKGDKGDQGPIGPSNGYSAIIETVTPWTLAAQEVLSKNVPAGSYIINSKVYANNNGGAQALVECDLLIDDSVVDDGPLTPLAVNNAAGEREYFVQAAGVNLDSGAELRVVCDAPTTTGSWSNRVLTAVKVGELG